jgi:hypothetical protein
MPPGDETPLCDSMPEVQFPDCLTSAKPLQDFFKSKMTALRDLEQAGVDGSSLCTLMNEVDVFLRANEENAKKAGTIAEARLVRREASYRQIQLNRKNKDAVASPTPTVQGPASSRPIPFSTKQDAEIDRLKETAAECNALPKKIEAFHELASSRKLAMEMEPIDPASIDPALLTSGLHATRSVLIDMTNALRTAAKKMWTFRLVNSLNHTNMCVMRLGVNHISIPNLIAIFSHIRADVHTQSAGHAMVLVVSYDGEHKALRRGINGQANTLQDVAWLSKADSLAHQEAGKHTSKCEQKATLAHQVLLHAVPTSHCLLPQGCGVLPKAAGSTASDSDALQPPTAPGHAHAAAPAESAGLQSAPSVVQPNIPQTKEEFHKALREASPPAVKLPFDAKTTHWFPKNWGDTETAVRELCGWNSGIAVSAGVILRLWRAERAVYDPSISVGSIGELLAQTIFEKRVIASKQQGHDFAKAYHYPGMLGGFLWVTHEDYNHKLKREVAAIRTAASTDLVRTVERCGATLLRASSLIASADRRGLGHVKKILAKNADSQNVVSGQEIMYNQVLRGGLVEDGDATAASLLTVLGNSHMAWDMEGLEFEQRGEYLEEHCLVFRMLTANRLTSVAGAVATRVSHLQFSTHKVHPLRNISHLYFHTAKRTAAHCQAHGRTLSC